MVEQAVRCFRRLEILAFLALITLGASMKVSAQTWNQPILQPETKSTQRTIELAEQLNKIGAKFFGAHWYPACKE